MSVRYQPLAAVITLLFVSFCSACSSNTENADTQSFSSEQIKELSREESEKGHIEQAQILEDGQVTAAEYNESYQNLRECLETFGYVISDPQISPLTQLHFEFTIDTSGYDQDQSWQNIEDCEETFWNNASRAYLGSNEHQLSAQLLQATAACLRNQGTPPAENVTNLKQIVDSPGVDEEQAVNCTREQMRLLYPEFEVFSITY